MPSAAVARKTSPRSRCCGAGTRRRALCSSVVTLCGAVRSSLRGHDFPPVTPTHVRCPVHMASEREHMPRLPRIVRIGPEEIERAAAMHGRCSTHTLWSRYHRAMGDPRTYLTALLGRPGSVHLAAQDASGRLVALGHLMPDGDSAEAALLVEDERQNSGLGTRLLLHLAHHAVRGGWEEIYGLLLPGDERISAILRHVDVEVHSREEGGVTVAWAKTVDLATALPATRRDGHRGRCFRRSSPAGGQGCRR